MVPVLQSFEHVSAQPQYEKTKARKSLAITKLPVVSTAVRRMYVISDLGMVRGMRAAIPWSFRMGESISRRLPHHEGVFILRLAPDMY